MFLFRLDALAQLITKIRPCNQRIKIGVPEVFQRIPRNSSTNIFGIPWQ
jgi:hypothetical protein